MILLAIVALHANLCFAATGYVTIDSPKETYIEAYENFRIEGNYSVTSDDTPTGQGMCPGGYYGIIGTYTPYFQGDLNWRAYAWQATYIDDNVVAGDYYAERPIGSVQYLAYNININSFEVGSTHIVRFLLKDIYGQFCGFSRQMLQGDPIAEQTVTFKRVACKVEAEFTADKTVMRPYKKEVIGFHSNIKVLPENSSTNPPNWSIEIKKIDSGTVKIFSGSGKVVDATWDGKDLTGNVVPGGDYTATLIATSKDGKCSKTKRVNFVVEACDLKITGTKQTVDPYTGGDINISGNISDSSGSQINWTIALPNGETKSGVGASPSALWDGKDGSGKIVKPGSYTATIRAQNGNNCSDTIDIPIVVTPSKSSCALLVQIGSSAHVANGNLSHSQELFSTRGGPMPAGMTLYYNSLDPHNGSLGQGWSHSYDISLKENSDGSVLISEPNWRYQYFTLSDGTYIPQAGNYSTLTKQNDNSFILTEKDGTRYNFGSDGKIASIADRNDNTLSFAYITGNLTTITDPAGRITTLGYDAANHLTSVTEQGNSYIFAYSSNTLTSVTYPDGGTWRYTYDANGFMLSKTDPMNATTSYQYDANHRVATSIDPEGNSRSIAYPATSDKVKSTTFIEKDGGNWVYSYDTEKGTLKSKTDPQGGIISYSYDAAGNRTSTTFTDGTTSSATYDSQGNVTSTIDSLGQTTDYTYNSFGQVLSVTDPAGAITAYSYDAKGNMIAITDPTGATTKYEYDAKGNMTRTTNPLGQATNFTYDSKGNLATVTDPNNATTSFTYDSAGNIASQTDVNGATTRFEYNARNQLIKVIDPNNTTTSYSYDANGNKLSETDANGNSTRYEYNSRNQLVRTIDAMNNSTSFAYGGTGCTSCGGGSDKLTNIIDANANSTTYHYDQLGRLVKESDPLGNTITYSYDAKGNLTSKADAKGATITYSYDGLGRLLKKLYPDNTEESFTYDVKGNILTATNKNISYTFGYDTAGRIRSVADSTGRVISYEYDVLGNKTKMISPEGKSITYTYDKANLLSSMINGGTFSFGYDTLGRRTSLAYPNGDSATYGYDKEGKLITLTRRNGAGSIISSNSYTHDKIGNRITNTTQERSSNYSYDHLYRLTQAITNTPGYSTNTKSTKGTGNAVQQQKEFYTYDPVGNRLASDNNRRYSYGPGNQLTSDNGASYGYDRNGNLTQKATSEGTTTYEWDYENRLIKVTTPTTTAEYAYDPFGRRIQKKVTENGETVTANYFYDGHAILFEYDETGTIGNRYIHGPSIDEPLMLTTGSEKHYYHADGLGSVVALTDQGGKIVQTYEYDSFGNLKDQKYRIKQPFTYTGREIDREAGLYYYRARTYDPGLGRFISKDPIGFKGGINLFAYTKDNPVNFTDPRGLDVYACTTGFDMFDGDIIGPARHDYHCWGEPGSKNMTCRGFGRDPNSNPFAAIIHADGKIIKDKENDPNEKGTCQEVTKDKCIEACIARRWNELEKKVPSYSWVGLGEDCQNVNYSISYGCYVECVNK
jgi:RHS repeat-associated protein